MTKVTPSWKRNVCKRNSYFDNIIKVLFENRNSIFIIFWFIAFFPPQLLKSFWIGNSRTSWWDKFWLKNSTFVSNTWLLNKINVGYHCPESWVQGMEWISRKFSILNGKYLKKKKRDITEYSIILPGVSSDLKQNQRCHLYVGPQSKVCVFSLSLFFLLNLFVGVKEDIAM